MQNEDEAIQTVLLTWANEARRGRASDFRGWTFFETNCLSELVRLTQAGHAKRVQSFLSGRDVLISGTVLSELSAASAIAEAAGDLLSETRVFIVPDITRFFECDLWNFINVEQHPRNVLDVFPMPSDLFASMNTHERFKTTARESRTFAEERFLSRVQPDIGATLDERQLLALIWSKINSAAKDWLKIDIPTADARPDRFPTFFTFHYAYYFRYIKSRTARPRANDFNDLTNIVAAPYCSDFFTEKTIAGILRTDVQGRVASRPVDVAKHLNRRGVVSTDSYQKARGTEAQTLTNAPLLQNTRIWTVNDLRDQVLTAP